jgi:type I restriction enzyme, R subunit
MTCDLIDAVAKSSGSGWGVCVKEARARIKINKALEVSGWRFFDEPDGPANIVLEPKIKLTSSVVDAFGEDFELATNGFVDFLLLDESGRPFVVLEAKAESRDPLVGKEQARKYAKSQNCRFVILSNGNLHYLWDLERGNPNIITALPKPVSLLAAEKLTPNPDALVKEQVERDYIVLTQRPGYRQEAGWTNESERDEFISTNGLRFLRDYQVRAIHKLQQAVEKGNDRFLFEMATGTGKTLTSAAVIKLFLRTRNASRVVFLVDRLELESQAKKAFDLLLRSDAKTIIYKENRDDWRHADIVVSTVQSFLFNNKFASLFSPTDFDLVISDEAHRSIGGNARAVFEYFTGYKLGLTATPRDYLKKFDASNANDPREHERRLLLDTYRTFGCEDGTPTFRYSLLDGVRDGYLINPTVVDARTDTTTQLLSDHGFIVTFTDDDGGEQEESFSQRQFEKNFFSPETNRLFCATFLENALADPISEEMGKSIIFAVSQHHAGKLVQILNELADQRYPGRYQSDFAVQVTSQISGAQQMTINFANNRLLGVGNVIPEYKTSKARVCVTVGMMTTGYDCPDILNLGLFRPIFSATEFIQIKGRGTRRHEFTDELYDPKLKTQIGKQPKAAFKLFDFFANCEYFEEEFDYDEVLALPKPTASPLVIGGGHGSVVGGPSSYTHLGPDQLASVSAVTIGFKGMKVDRMFFERFEERVKEDSVIVEHVEAGEWDKVIDYVNEQILSNEREPYSLEKLRQATDVDRRIGLREILEKIFGLIPRFKSKDELLEEEFGKFVADRKPSEVRSLPAMKRYFKAYASSDKFRIIIDGKDYTKLSTNPGFKTADFKAVPEAYRSIIPEYIKDYVPLNRFAA